jgi:hypothetical protein
MEDSNSHIQLDQYELDYILSLAKKNLHLNSARDILAQHSIDFECITCYISAKNALLKKLNNNDNYD